MKILLVDNYDSFTYNLVHYFEGFDCDVDVVRNDELKGIVIDEYDKIVLSPGPGLPKEAAGMMEIIENWANKKPILGVCLGFQALVEHFGGDIYNQSIVKHGQAEKCNFDTTSKLFKGLPQQFNIGLYHSWAALRNTLPDEFVITANSENDVIMAIEHKSLPICGVQFHPESILTENGKEIIANFIRHFN
ncbi:aminodeoxychorismate/anthranilate synthase component II [Paracrocinitomix mangrovi]|uniref:anthranilate synthase component II n=1 Tax=Paracrocinitomix mangrovi TaxID=2862509 RepID=UPI001C8D385D|nr:aminodeoxychorismate/anthranilate synthase component II [Paracrocinitomix mangrovi]UKN02084.1 aminodeoxychorismate/anthranilate synthase component II [Paracrocinitomix mangrovi]